jgi:sugar O-acyltransferase (sialic acid O-acetyltransferase NeuD family)
MNKKIFLNKKIISLNEFMKIKENTNIFLAIGENSKRRKIFNLIKKKKKNNFPNIFYEKNTFLKNTKFGIGNLVMPGCIINNDVKIENFCILNTGSIIEHDCKIGSFNSISPGAVLSGNCETKENVFIGSNATIIHNIKIGKKSVIGAGTVVTKNVGDNSRIVGNPNRKIKQKINYL